jgi:hypothetical protein
MVKIEMIDGYTYIFPVGYLRSMAKLVLSDPPSLLSFGRASGTMIE